MCQTCRTTCTTGTGPEFDYKYGPTGADCNGVTSVSGCAKCSTAH